MNKIMYYNFKELNAIYCENLTKNENVSAQSDIR